MNLFGNLLLVNLALVITIYLIGTAMLAVFKIKAYNFYESVFNKLFVGFSILGIIYASIASHGTTILLILAAVVFAVLIQWKTTFANATVFGPDTAKPATDVITEISFVALINFTVYLIRFFILYDFKSPYLRVPYQDYIFYGRLSGHIVSSGVESSSLEPIYSCAVSPVPYHYIELWVNGLCSQIFDVPNVYCLYLATFSAIIAIVLTGIMALLSFLQVRKAWVPLLAFLLLNATGVVWPFLRTIDFFSNSAPGFAILLLVVPKLCIVYVYLIVAVLFLLRQQYIGFGVAASALPLVFISTAPVLGITIVLFALVLYLRTKVSAKQALLIVLPIVAVGISLGLFYLFQSKAKAGVALGPALPTLVTLLPSGQGRVILNVFIGSAVCYAVFNGVYFFLITSLLRRSSSQLSITLKQQWPLILWFGIVLVVALTIRACLNNYAEAFQVMSNILMPATAIFLVVLFGLSFAKASFVMRLSVALVLAGVVVMNVLSLYRRDYLHLDTDSNIYYTPDFLTKVDKFIGSGDRHGAFVLDESDYDNLYNFNQDSHIAGTYVPCLLDTNQELFLPSLSVLDISPALVNSRFKPQATNLLQFINASMFAKFVAERHRLSNRNMPLDSMKYQFIKAHNISFLCLSAKAKLPPIIRSLVQTVYVDEYSKEKFCVLK